MNFQFAILVFVASLCFVLSEEDLRSEIKDAIKDAVKRRLYEKEVLSLLEDEETDDLEETIELLEDKSNDQDETVFKQKDPFFRFRVRLPNPFRNFRSIRFGRLIRQVRKIRLPLPKIFRFSPGLLKYRVAQKFFKINVPQEKNAETPPDPNGCTKAKSENAIATMKAIECDPLWKQDSDVHEAFIGKNGVFVPACIAHNICTTCMQREHWTAKQCLDRLRTNMVYSCDSLDNDQDVKDYCKQQIKQLVLISKYKSYPAIPASNCNSCLTPKGDPNKPLE